MHDAGLRLQYYKDWRILDPEQRKVVNCSDVEFDENQTAHISSIDNENDALGLPEQEPIYTEEQVDNFPLLWIPYSPNLCGIVDVAQHHAWLGTSSHLGVDPLLLWDPPACKTSKPS